jgi:hypothetical protein
MSDHTRIANSDQRLEEVVAEIRRAYRNYRYVEVEITEGERKRTLTQNAALHLFCRFLAETLNDAGLDMRIVIKPEVEIAWNTYSVKEYLWKPVQRAMQGKESTTEANRTDYTEVHEALSRHLAQRFGVQVPDWPKRKEVA